jgi:hypothetical protein
MSKDVIDDHDIQKSFAKLPADFGCLKIVVNTIYLLKLSVNRRHHEHHSGDASLKDHDIQIMELCGTTASTKPVIEQHEQLEKRLEKVEQNFPKGNSCNGVLRYSTERMETYLAKLGSIPSHFDVLNDHTKVSNDGFAHPKKSSSGSLISLRMKSTR